MVLEPDAGYAAVSFDVFLLTLSCIFFFKVLQRPKKHENINRFTSKPASQALSASP
jgi:hypothetical protein